MVLGLSCAKANKLHLKFSRTFGKIQKLSAIIQFDTENKTCILNTITESDKRAGNVGTVILRNRNNAIHCRI